jgi:phosphoribosylanthranilate isomerase
MNRLPAVLQQAVRPRVTITGADDSVDPMHLFALSDEFPFVEWAMLASPKRMGSRRYPSASWLRTLVTRAGVSDRLALHLCGDYATRAIKGEAQVLRSRVFGRVQINGYEPGQPYGLSDIADDLGTTFILQCRRPEHLGKFLFDANEVAFDCSVLLDASAGQGLSPDWQQHVTAVAREGMGARRVGFAGGITPDNVLDVIRSIGPRPWVKRGRRWESYWIDMESGVRTDDRLDLTKVRRVLERVAELTDPNDALDASYRSPQ